MRQAREDRERVRHLRHRPRRRHVRPTKSTSRLTVIVARAHETNLLFRPYLKQKIDIFFSNF